LIKVPSLINLLCASTIYNKSQKSQKKSKKIKKKGKTEKNREKLEEKLNLQKPLLQEEPPKKKRNPKPSVGRESGKKNCK
jgi:hypothetical protein